MSNQNNQSVYKVGKWLPPQNSEGAGIQMSKFQGVFSPDLEQNPILEIKIKQNNIEIKKAYLFIYHYLQTNLQCLLKIKNQYTK